MIKKTLANKEVVYEDCLVNWIGWERKKGGHLKRSEEQADNCTVIVDGAMCSIILPSGFSFRKRLSTDGFFFKTNEELKKQKKEQRLWEIKQKEIDKKEKRIINLEKKIMNARLKSILKDRTTKIFVADYFDCAVRDHCDDKQNIDIIKLDVELTKITRKELSAELKECGFKYAKRTIRECDRNSFSRLGIEKLVVIAESEEAATDLLNQNAVKYIERCAEEFDNGIDEYCEFYDVSKERYNELSGNEQPKP